MDNSVLIRLKQRYGIVGNCEGLNRAIEVALKIAPVDLSVLITGENGVGKESFPRIIHDHSLRKNKKYFAVNCGAIPEGTIDSELFGHEKGAFTGAIDQRDGYFAVANEGTLFLDEVGELPLQTQARLLRVLETGEYIRVGSSEVRKTNVRIVAATNVNIEKAIANGKFREDLYYRLNTINITVPALRERGDDAILLFRKFALDMSEKYRMPPIRLTEDSQKMLAAYTWPGNVRQLKNLTENMSVTAEQREITPEILSHYLPRETNHTQLVTTGEKSSSHSFENEREILYQILFDLRRDVTELKNYVREQRVEKNSTKRIVRENGHQVVYRETSSQDNVVSSSQGKELPYCAAEEVKDNLSAEVSTPSLPQENAPQSLDQVEREMVKRALADNKGRRKVAADKLGISERTLYRKIKEYGLD